MAHTLAQGSESQTLVDVHELCSHFFDTSVNFETKLDQLLESETERFDLEYGFMTQVDVSTDTQEVMTAHGDHELLQPEKTCPLSQSYCRKTITQPEGTMRVSNALEEGWEDDPAYDLFELGSYVGATVETRDDVYGTVCFASSDPRRDPITDAEVLIVDLFSQWIAHELTTQTTQTDLDHQSGQIHTLAEIVSHDLRNPLSVAAGQLTLLDESVQESLQRIDRAHGRMERIIEDMLTLTRLDSPVTDSETVDLGPCVTEAWEMVDTGEATLETDLGTTQIDADRERLDRLLENLFRNAIEYAGDGVTVRVGSLLDGFYVEDDGPGIPESERDLVFDPGYSVAPKGTGFGLSIVRQIVEAHDWEIAITEGSEGGARFEVTDVTSLD